MLTRMLVTILAITVLVGIIHAQPKVLTPTVSNAKDLRAIPDRDDCEEAKKFLESRGIDTDGSKHDYGSSLKGFARQVGDAITGKDRDTPGMSCDEAIRRARDLGWKSQQEKVSDAIAKSNAEREKVIRENQAMLDALTKAFASGSWDQVVDAVREHFPPEVVDQVLPGLKQAFDAQAAANGIPGDRLVPKAVQAAEGPSAAAGGNPADNGAVGLGRSEPSAMSPDEAVAAAIDEALMATFAGAENGTAGGALLLEDVFGNMLASIPAGPGSVFAGDRPAVSFEASTGVAGSSSGSELGGVLGELGFFGGDLEFGSFGDAQVSGRLASQVESAGVTSFQPPPPDRVTSRPGAAASGDSFDSDLAAIAGTSTQGSSQLLDVGRESVLANDPASVTGGYSSTIELGSFLAHFSSDTYSYAPGSSQGVTSTGPHGSSVLFTVSLDNGLKATVYDTKVYGEDTVVVAYTGTVDAQDWATNIGAHSGVPAEFDSAVDLARDVSAKYPDKQVVLTGHSQGGGQAAYVGGMTGFATFVYNSMGTEAVQNAVRDAGGDTSHVVEFSGSNDWLTAGRLISPHGGRPWGGQRWNVPMAKHSISQTVEYMELWRQLGGITPIPPDGQSSVNTSGGSR